MAPETDHPEGAGLLPAPDWVLSIRALQIAARPRSSCAPTVKPPTRAALRAPGRTQDSYSPASVARLMSRATSTGNSPIGAGKQESVTSGSTTPGARAPRFWSRSTCTPGSPCRYSAQPDRHDDGGLQRGADSQDQECSQAVGQAARWLELLYFRAVRDRKGPATCSKPVFDQGGAEGI